MVASPHIENLYQETKRRVFGPDKLPLTDFITAFGHPDLKWPMAAHVLANSLRSLIDNPPFEKPNTMLIFAYTSLKELGDMTLAKDGELTTQSEITESDFVTNSMARKFDRTNIAVCDLVDAELHKLKLVTGLRNLVANGYAAYVVNKSAVELTQKGIDAYNDYFVV